MELLIPDLLVIYISPLSGVVWLSFYKINENITVGDKLNTRMVIYALHNIF